MTNQDEYVHGLCWNIQSGGFSSYDQTLTRPNRGEAIRCYIEAYQDQGVDTVTLTDAYRWDEIYDGELGIALHLGFGAARFVRLEDERLKRDHGSGIGIAFATDKKIAETRTLDLETRQGLGVVLDIGKYGLQIANVYLDDMDESVRETQLRALLASIHPNMPTVIKGDFNTLRNSLAGSSLGTKARDAGVRFLASVLPHNSPLGQSIRGMNERSALSIATSKGFIDGDPKRRPTAPTKLPGGNRPAIPLFGIDYVLHNSGVDMQYVRPTKSGRASDHLALEYRGRVS